jgi:hypothetical protein
MSGGIRDRRVLRAVGIANGEMNRHDLNAASAALQQAQRLQPDRAAVKQTTDRLQSMQHAR